MNEDYEQAAQSAARELQQAQTADDVRKIWKKYYLVLGHRSLGRLLLGRPAAELVARHEARSE
ncbi:MAG: hypothetical protein ABSC13_05440 [Dehalococcoidia bacterium]|jgi:hypothetical protein